MKSESEHLSYDGKTWEFKVAHFTKYGVDDDDDDEMVDANEEPAPSQTEAMVDAKPVEQIVTTNQAPKEAPKSTSLFCTEKNQQASKLNF
jgi:hypothetical protein